MEPPISPCRAPPPQSRSDDPYDSDEDIPLEELTDLLYEIDLNKIEGSHSIAVRSLQTCKLIITNQEWSSADELMKIIRNQVRICALRKPHLSIFANIARRVLKLIREEYDLLLGNQIGDDSQEAALSLHRLVTQTSENEPIRDYSKPNAGLKVAVLDHFDELESELELTAENLAAQAAEHILSGELILTLGYSRTVENFLKRAAKQRKFDVVVAECAPECHGHDLAKSLAEVRIDTTVITDAAVFAIMSRVTKVIIGTHSVMANSGLHATCGALTMALAAKKYSVPFIVLVPNYKLSPTNLFGSEQDAFNLLANSCAILPYSSPAARFTTIYNPIFDYVPPELVTLMISNAGGNAKLYIYRLLSELYHPEDYDL